MTFNLIENHKIIEQKIKFSYLGMEFTLCANIENEVGHQINKANKISGYFNCTRVDMNVKDFFFR